MICFGSAQGEKDRGNDGFVMLSACRSSVSWHCPECRECVAFLDCALFMIHRHSDSGVERPRGTKSSLGIVLVLAFQQLQVSITLLRVPCMLERPA